MNLMDSDAGRALATRLGVGKMRHIQVRWLWLQERVREGDLAVKRVDGAQNVADLTTKYLEAVRRDELLDLMGLRLTRRRLTSPTQATVTAALLQATAASRDGSGGEDEGLVTIVSFFLWFIDDVMKAVLVAAILTIIAYRLLTWPAAAAAVTPQLGDGGPRLRSWTAAAVQTDSRDEEIRDLDWLTTEQLKVLCRRRGLATSGVKADLRGRLEATAKWTLTTSTRTAA